MSLIVHRITIVDRIAVPAMAGITVGYFPHVKLFDCDKHAAEKNLAS
jgi:hypothetical protein